MSWCRGIMVSEKSKVKSQNQKNVVIFLVVLISVWVVLALFRKTRNDKRTTTNEQVVEDIKKPRKFGALYRFDIVINSVPVH